MKLKWTKQALEGFNNIQSRYFTPNETKAYKKDLVKRIQAKVSHLGTSITATKIGWEGSYKIIVDQYINTWKKMSRNKSCIIASFSLCFDMSCSSCFVMIDS